MAATCPVCGKPAGSCLWTDVVKHTLDNRVFNYTEPLPYNAATESFDVSRIKEILPYPKYILLSQKPEAFTESEIERVDVKTTGAYCTNCNSLIQEG